MFDKLLLEFRMSSFETPFPEIYLSTYVGTLRRQARDVQEVGNFLILEIYHPLLVRVPVTFWIN